jgi:ribosomal protein S18 acetylase RimI-like enzyme
MSAERGATYLVVRTVHTNEAAKAFYASLGYSPDEIAFVKRLGS